MLRDSRKDLDYFNSSIDFYVNQINKYTINFDSYPKKSEVLDIIATARYKKLLLEYCKGANLTELRKEYETFIDALINYVEYPDKQLDASGDLLDTYIDALTILSFAYLFKVDDKTFNKVITFLDKTGTDKLLDQLLSFKFENRKKNSKLFFPKKFKALSDFLECETKDSNFLYNYTKDWYKGMRTALFYNSHNDKQGTMYNGYWCWEAAFLVCLLDTDDSNFRKIAVYPTDMTDFYKNNK